MASLDSFAISRLSAGNIQQATRWQVEGVYLDGVSVYFDAVASTDTLTNPNREHSFVVDDRVWLQRDPASPDLPGGLSQRVQYVVSVNGTDLQLSETLGGPVTDITSDGRVVLTKLSADYRASVNEEILFAFKTNLAADLTEEQKRDVIETLSKKLIDWKFENEGG